MSKETKVLAAGGRFTSTTNDNTTKTWNRLSVDVYSVENDEWELSDVFAYQEVHRFPRVVCVPKPGPSEFYTLYKKSAKELGLAKLTWNSTERKHHWVEIGTHQAISMEWVIAHNIFYPH